MDSEIIGEDEKDIGTETTDNNGIVHQIEIHKRNGKIYAHKQSGYSHKSKERNLEDNEHVNQARRYAKWTVYRERGYQTLAPYDNPDHIAGAMLALSNLSEARIESEFDDLREQLRSHFDGSTVELPFEGADPDDVIVYRKDVYVQPDPADFDPPVLERLLSGNIDPTEAISDLMSDDSDGSTLVSEFEVEAVSDLHYLHRSDEGLKECGKEDVLDREPEARIELLPIPVDDFDSYKLLLVSHLSHQIRDCFLMMGCDPPLPFQMQGLGKYKATVTQALVDLYNEHYLADEQVGAWIPEE